MRPAHPHDGTGDDRPPIDRHEFAVDNGVPERHLHPTVVAEDPERRQHGPQRNHAAGEKIEPRRRAVAAEQHHAEERRLQHERGKALIAEQRPLDRPGALRQHAPVGAELKRHDDASDHAHAERQREHLQPEVEHAPIDRIAGREPHSFEGREPSGEPDGEGGKNDVEADDEGELDARKKYGVEVQFRLQIRAQPATLMAFAVPPLRHQLALQRSF